MALNRVVVVLVARCGFTLPLLALEVMRTLEDNFLALAAMGFMKLKLALGVVLLALEGLAGVRVADEVIRMGLERAVMLGVDVVGLILLAGPRLEKPFFSFKGKHSNEGIKSQSQMHEVSSTKAPYFCAHAF